MGINLKPLTVKKTVELENLREKSLAVDANNVLHQFLASIRTADGRLLKDSEGKVISHLIGLLHRSTRLIYDHHLQLVFVFDGEPPKLKEEELEKRRKRRKQAKREWEEALDREDYAAARSEAVKSSRLTSSMLDDAKRLLKLLGIPHLQAPSEAEAQIAYMNKKGDVWASNTRDYDALLFGTPRLVRYLTVSEGKPELVTLHELLSHNKITLEQLVDLAILIGTDYNQGVKGVGPKTGLKLMKKHGRIESLPADVRSKVSRRYERVRKIFLEPEVISDYPLEYGEFQETQIYRFLCDQRDLSESRVETAVERMKSFYKD